MNSKLPFTLLIAGYNLKFELFHFRTVNMDTILYRHLFRTSTPSDRNKLETKNLRVAKCGELVTTEECLERAREKLKKQQPKKKSAKVRSKLVASNID